MFKKHRSKKTSMFFQCFFTCLVFLWLRLLGWRIFHLSKHRNLHLASPLDTDGDARVLGKRWIHSSRRLKLEQTFFFFLMQCVMLFLPIISRVPQHKFLSLQLPETSFFSSFLDYFQPAHENGVFLCFAFPRNFFGVLMLQRENEKQNLNIRQSSAWWQKQILENSFEHQK
jgi:hypothetical protein